MISKYVCKDLFSTNALAQSDFIQALIHKSFGVKLNKDLVNENVSQKAKDVIEEVKKQLNLKI